LNTQGQSASENPGPGYYGAFTLGSDGNAYGNNSSETGNLFRLAITPLLPAPVQVSLSPAAAVLGAPVTASLAVNNAFSLTMQQCYAFVTNSGVVTALGKVPGSYNSATQLYTASVTVTPAETGTYRYAVTCGGVESGSATLTVDGHPTKTTLTASPATVDPPGNVSLAATVTRTDGSTVPTGTVAFYYQTVLLGSAKLNGSGVATLAASSQGVAPGTYAVTAKYTGDTVDAGSTSAAVSVAVE
jgi:hypothetical protein